MISVGIEVHSGKGIKKKVATVTTKGKKDDVEITRDISNLKFIREETTIEAMFQDCE